jgi:hypothetical protein
MTDLKISKELEQNPRPSEELKSKNKKVQDIMSSLQMTVRNMALSSALEGVHDVTFRYFFGANQANAYNIAVLEWCKVFSNDN